MAIRKEIFVTQKRLDPILNVTYKSDLLQIELDVQDFDIPEGTTAIAYAIGESRVVKEEKCSVVGNIISFSPANLFEEGKGLLQIELTNAGKQLSTFKIKVECEGLVKESGVDPSVIKKGTITIEESATSIEVDTGLSNIDMIIIYKEADTTQNNTNGWIYSDLYTGIMYFSYSTSVSMKYWAEGTRYASISEGIVSAEQRSSSYPVLAGEYSWMAVGTE